MEINSDDDLYIFFSELGLNEYEKKAYQSILEGGIIVAREISSISGIPYAKVYQTLDALTEKGLVEGDGGRPRKFKVKNPASAIKRLLDTMKEDWLATHTAKEQSLERVIPKINTLYEVSQYIDDQDEGVWTIRGMKNIEARIRNLLKSKISEVIISSDDKLIIEKCLKLIPNSENRIILRTSTDFTNLDHVKLIKLNWSVPTTSIIFDEYAMITITENKRKPKDHIAVLNQMPDVVKTYRMEIGEV